MQHNNHNKEDAYGVLDVSGKDELDITIHHYPKHVTVEFIDDQIVSPCCPTTTDTLNWDLNLSGSEKKLKICWHVSGSRQIRWEIKF